MAETSEASQEDIEFEAPPKDVNKLPDWIRNYLKPKNGRSFKANQFTINGITYPFVRDFHFAAVPYPINRRYSMLAGLETTRPGDLVFFFQSDPQWTNKDINSRRGLRGIYRVISKPFHDNQTIMDQKTGYKLFGVCPHCNSPNANLSDKCIICGNGYPKIQIPSRKRSNPYHFLVMGCRIDIEPIAIFERSVSDERAYADMSDTGMIWIGRHDNQMGAGKGSSIRQLLSEEAVKLTGMMLSEPGQKVSIPKKILYPNPRLPILNPEGNSAEYMEINKRPIAGDYFVKELSLNYYIAKTIDDPNSAIGKILSNVIDFENLEYFSSEFPWGYTAGESDFICSFRNENGRYKIIPLEFKRDWIDDDAIIQVSLYVPWVIQVMSQFAVPPPKEIEIIPIAIGMRLKAGTSRPKPYKYTASFNSGVKVNVDVKSPIVLEYTPINLQNLSGKAFAKDLTFTDKSSNLNEINWTPPIGIVTSQVEREWVRKTSWKDAKENV